MTITRLWQAGAELKNIGELTEDATYGDISVMTVSTAKARTGAYSFSISRTTRPRGRVLPSTTQIRSGYFVNHQGLASNTSAWRALLYYVKSTVDILVRWGGDTNDLELVVNGTLRASADASTIGFSTQDVWYHLGITCKAHSSTGFVSVYLNGVQILTYTGDTGTDITGLYFGGSQVGAGWNGTAYVDDFYVDDTVGEANAAPPSPRFSFLLPSGSGSNTAWTPNTGANYAAVDDSAAPDDDTTYVLAASSGLKDSYALTNTSVTTVPSGYTVEAVIPALWARKTDAGTASTIKAGTRLSGTEVVGSAQTLTTSYGPIFERQTTKPGGGAWTTTDVDSAEVLIESAGSY